MNTEIVDRLKNIERMLRMLIAGEAEDDPMKSTETLSPSSTPRWKNNEYMTPDDIAKEIGVDPHTVRRWLRDGEMPYTKFGRAVRVKTKDYEKYRKDNYIG